LYTLLFCGVIALGLSSRRYASHLPGVIATYGGDTLWAVMVFIGMGLLQPRASSLKLAVLAATISYLDELTQLYHAPWLDAIRHTMLGGLVLGYGFLWSDLVCYTMGIAVVACLETILVRRRLRKAPDELN
jgi:hypothetical protein